MELRKLDSLGSVSIDTPEGNIEVICWAHRGDGWEIRDERGAGRCTGARTKRAAVTIAKGWAEMKPARTYEHTPIGYEDLVA